MLILTSSIFNPEGNVQEQCSLLQSNNQSKSYLQFETNPNNPQKIESLEDNLNKNSSGR